MAPRAVIFLLFLLSGGAGLIYEVVWTRELVFVFGGTTYAITTILVAFMTGLGLGSYIAGRRSPRLQRPGRVYGLLEIGIGLYALTVPFLLHVAEPLYRLVYPRVTGAPWLLTGARFLIAVLIFVVPTTLMGATLPILVRYVTTLGQNFGRAVGLLYGINTLGAMIGTAAAGFLLLPALGLSATARVAASLNLLVGLTAIALLRSREAPQRSGLSEVPAGPPAAGLRADRLLSPALRRLVLGAFALSGLASMVYQIAWTRALVMSLGSSTYSFTCILTAFIGGLAVGSLVIARWVDRLRDPVSWFAALEILIGLAAVLIAPLYGRAPGIVHSLVSEHKADYARLLAAEMLLVIAVTFVPTLLMGAIFPVVTRVIALDFTDPGAATGQAYAVNTAGTILGSFLAGFVLIRSDVLGVQNSIMAAAAVNVLVGAALAVAPRAPAPGLRRRVLPAAAAILLVPLAGLSAGRWEREALISAPFFGRTSPETFKQEHRLLHYAEGTDVTVGVVQLSTDPEALFMSVNGKVDASTTADDMTTQLLLGHIPALLVEPGRSACIIGLGSGMTLNAVACYPSYRQIDCVEISREVIDAAVHFRPYCPRLAQPDPRIRMIRADGRNHLLLTDQRYDLIISEPSNPWIAGIANLFTREYFQLCRDRLTENGRACVWLHTYMMSVSDFRMVLRTLLDVFECVSVWRSCVGDCILVAGSDAGPVSVDRMAERFAVDAVREDLYRINATDVGHVLARYVTSGDGLRRWVESAPLHTDDHARLEFSAPRHIYSEQTHRISALLFAMRRPPFEEAFRPSADPWRMRTIDRHVQSASEAYRIYFEAADAAAREDVVSVFEKLVAAYARYPESLELYMTVGDQRHRLLQQMPAFARSAEGRRLLGELEAVRPIVHPAKRGASSRQIAEMFVRFAAETSEKGHWDWAVSYLENALNYAPDDDLIRALLPVAMARAGRIDEAIAWVDDWRTRSPGNRHATYVRARLAAHAGDVATALDQLEAAMRQGEVTPAMLEADPMLEPLRRDPRYRKLLTSGAATQPAQAPRAP